METIRKPFQGISNIIRFNWHFYAIAAFVIIALGIFQKYLPHHLSLGVTFIIGLIVLTIFISLAVSYYIYDYSSLYTFDWLNQLKIKDDKCIVNISAGFDETSAILAEKFPQTKLKVFDFYDAAKHTEVSIERACKAYPPYPRTEIVNTNAIPLENNSVDIIFLILAAHEIRNNEERIHFFSQLKKSLTSQGKIIVVEHTRDMYNFMAYTIGFFHFLSKNTWLKSFSESDLKIKSSFKITPFITVFVLQ
jgi:hypothetical protein